VGADDLHLIFFLRDENISNTPYSHPQQYTCLLQSWHALFTTRFLPGVVSCGDESWLDSMFRV
jgi:hypothetical protein